MQSKVTTASVRIMLSNKWCNFEIIQGIENEAGISVEEIQNLRLQCFDLAVDAVNQHNEYIKSGTQTTSQGKSDIHVDDEIAKVEALPLYQGKKKTKADTQADTRAIHLINDCTSIAELNGIFKDLPSSAEVVDAFGKKLISLKKSK